MKARPYFCAIWIIHNFNLKGAPEILLKSMASGQSIFI
jgi:hypothetical protein